MLSLPPKPKSSSVVVFSTPAIIAKYVLYYVLSSMLLTFSTAAVTVVNGRVCGLRLDSFETFMASIAMSGSPVCKVLSSSSSLLHRLSDNLIVSGKFV
jgi:hypothetical protein